MVDTRADVLFEASWEVCNKVGGIYTVVKSKAALINDAYPTYVLLGPYIELQARDIFVQEQSPPEFQPVFDDLAREGIVCHYGMWQIKGEPKVVLLEFSGLAPQKNDIKKRLWDDFKIDSIYSQWDFEEPLLWATAVGKLIEKYVQHNNPNGSKKIVAHFHEWLAGFGLLHLKLQKVKVGTIFTTHATMLGRSIAGSGEPLYDILDALDPVKEAYNHGIQDKYLTEKACAEHTDVFTTVSEITAIEAEKILGRKADVLVLNGLDIEKFPTFEETSIKHRDNREMIREFVSYFFFPHYYFNLDETLFFFIVGRYEFKNKGIDIFIRALGKLNDKLKAEGSEKTIVTFFWIPRDVHGAKGELPINKSNYYQIKDFVRRNSSVLQHRVLNNIFQCPVDCFNDETAFNKGGLFDKDFLLESKKLRINFQKKGNPLLVTHNLPFEEQDTIVNELLKAGLDNREDDRVKMVFYPVYLTGIDGLIDLPYYDAIVGCHLGVFPSYYEPWGYTPLESAALGVPSLTTDLGGFGRFLMQKGVPNEGVFILKRFHVSEEETVEHFTEILYNYCKLTPKGRVRQKIIAKELSNLADWKELVNNYFEAHNLAIARVWGA
ncbi:hypothetical protein HY488_00065 [Candidatus Woesearchaeota archaeon]|nr:hypothetical protein [Candidatus Woesearchaeota archaeon]